MLRPALAAVAAAALIASASAGHAAIILYQAVLSGPNESPPNGSLATGFTVVTIDNIANTMEVDVSFSGLTSPDTASHIHCCTAVPGTGTAGVATVTPTFTGFPTGVTAGTYSHLFDLTLAGSYNPAFVGANGGTAAGAETALLAGLAAGEAYLNIHSQQFGGGEIRGFLTPVPEPGAWALMIAGLAAAGAALRRRRRPAVA